LPHPEIKCMVPDSDGAFWIGTGSGVVVMDAN